MWMRVWFEEEDEAIGEMDWPLPPRIDDQVVFNRLGDLRGEQVTGVVTAVRWKQPRCDTDNTLPPILQITVVPLADVENQGPAR